MLAFLQPGFVLITETRWELHFAHRYQISKTQLHHCDAPGQKANAAIIITSG